MANAHVPKESSPEEIGRVSPCKNYSWARYDYAHVVLIADVNFWHSACNLLDHLNIARETMSVLL